MNNNNDYQISFLQLQQELERVRAENSELQRKIKLYQETEKYYHGMGYQIDSQNNSRPY